jgi:hypothetical protein
MGYKFNPFTGNLDTVDSPNGVFEEIDVNGDITLDDGGTYTTTLQTVTPTANRTISFPNATGTVGLVAGSSGQLVYNNAGANAGVPSSTVSSTGNITLSLNGATGVPPVAVTGTWFAGTTPQVLIQPSNVGTAGAWSASGTGIGVNAVTGFTGNLLDLQVNGTSYFKVTSTVATNPNHVRLTTRSAFSNALGDGISTSNGGLELGWNNAAGMAVRGADEIRIAQTAVLGFGDLNGSPDATWARDAADTIAQRRGTNAQTFRVYNTFTSATNYERGKLEWASNVFRIGTEKGSGGGTARTVEVHTDSISRLALDTTGSVRVVTGLTVATLPGTPAVGMIARVTDATAPAVGSTVTGGGAAAALVWYNGANWSVIGV